MMEGADPTVVFLVVRVEEDLTMAMQEVPVLLDKEILVDLTVEAVEAVEVLEMGVEVMAVLAVLVDLP